MNAYLRCVDAHEDRAGMEAIGGMTGCGYSNTRGDVMAR